MLHWSHGQVGHYSTNAADAQARHDLGISQPQDGHSPVALVTGCQRASRVDGCHSAAGARFLESLKATNQELEEAQDLVCDQLRDGEYSELAGWDGWLAETIADEREWNEEPRDEAVQS